MRTLVQHSPVQNTPYENENSIEIRQEIIKLSADEPRGVREPARHLVWFCGPSVWRQIESVIDSGERPRERIYLYRIVHLLHGTWVFIVHLLHGTRVFTVQLLHRTWVFIVHLLHRTLVHMYTFNLRLLHGTQAFIYFTCCMETGHL